MAFFTDLTRKIGVFRCKFYSPKFCPCKNNDKYQVCWAPPSTSGKKQTSEQFLRAILLFLRLAAILTPDAVWSSWFLPNYANWDHNHFLQYHISTLAVFNVNLSLGKVFKGGNSVDSFGKFLERMSQHHLGHSSDDKSAMGDDLEAFIIWWVSVNEILQTW